MLDLNLRGSLYILYTTAYPRVGGREFGSLPLYTIAFSLFLFPCVWWGVRGGEGGWRELEFQRLRAATLTAARKFATLYCLRATCHPLEFLPLFVSVRIAVYIRTIVCPKANKHSTHLKERLFVFVVGNKRMFFMGFTSSCHITYLDVG